MDKDSDSSPQSSIMKASQEVSSEAKTKRPKSRQVHVSLKEMWEIYIKAVKSTDKSADNMKVYDFFSS